MLEDPQIGELPHNLVASARALSYLGDAVIGDTPPAGQGLALLWIGPEPPVELRRAIREVGLRLACVPTIDEAQPRIAAFVHDVVVVSSPGASPAQTVRAARAAIQTAWVVAIADDPEHVAEAVAAGAHDAAMRSGARSLCRWLVSSARAAVSGCERAAALEALAARAGSLVRRVAALGRENRALRDLSSQDGLTGLASRQGLDVQLQRAVTSGGRYGHPVSMILCDVDGLGRVNEQRGRPEGDATLRRLASILSGNIRGCDVAARRGDDEFAVILPSTPAEHAVRVAERIRTRAERELGGPAHRVTVSVGIAAFDPDAAPTAEAPGIDGLLEAAYRALRLAKRKGKNRIESATALFEAAEDDRTPVV